MRPFAFVPFALCGALSMRAAAQTGAQPNLVLTIVGGTVTGHGLWTIEKQLLSMPADATTYDTLQLSRDVTSGLVLGMAATYYSSPHVGLHAEISYLGLGLDSSCKGLYFHPDSSALGDLHRNEQVCDDIQSQATLGSMISIFGGATLRASSRRAFSPYLRGGIGFVYQSGSSIDVAGAFFDSGGILKVRQVIADVKPRHAAPMAMGAAGFTSSLGSGYQFRFEVRDHLINLIRLTGPGSASGPSPMASKYYHHIALTLALDIVMEKKRGRRY